MRMVSMRGRGGLAAAVLLATVGVGCGWAQEAAAAWGEEVLRRAGVTGGLVVHLGTRDAARTAALRVRDRILVQGLTPDVGRVDALRETVAASAQGGGVSILPLAGNALPYAESLVNLLIVEPGTEVLPDEVDRVLAPGGVALFQGEDGSWKTHTKARPDTIDDWTHFLHGADNNAVSHDRHVAPPRRLRWTARPRWARSHEHQGTVSAVVSSGGRVFAIVDYGPTASVTLPAAWRLVARDAFSGVKLWERDIARWVSHLRPFRSGPAHLPRRLVSVGDLVYVTLGIGEPVTALDGATGAVVRSFADTEGACEIVVSEGILYVVTGDLAGDGVASEAFRWGPSLGRKRLVALDATRGTVLWRVAGDRAAALLPLTLCVHGKRVLFHNTSALICLDATDGSEVWRASRAVSLVRPSWSTPTVVVSDGVVLCADRTPRSSPPAAGGTDGMPVQWVVSHKGGGAPGNLVAYDLDSGDRLWSVPCSEGYNFPADVFVVNGNVWTGKVIRSGDPGFRVARGIRSGEVTRERPADKAFFSVRMGHHRCYRNKATERFLLLGRAGVEFIDVATGVGTANHWVRGTCQYGVMPANGLLYVPPHSCACHIDAKLDGFNALGGGPDGPSAREQAPFSERLVHGSAFGLSAAGDDKPVDPADWPTYRYDSARRGSTPAGVPVPGSIAWRTALASPLSAPVVAGDCVLVSATDAHTVHALSLADGRSRWRHRTGGRIDSAPTVYRGKVLFGSADGCVTCLRLADGARVWRFRAAPDCRQLVASDQLESVWPVHGNVLVHDGVAFVSAGRSGFLDGGIHMYRLDAETGSVLTHSVLNSRDPATGGEPGNVVGSPEMPRVLSDVLSCDGSSVFMRHLGLSCADLSVDVAPKPHLWSVAGYLDDSFWHRSYWLLGPRYASGWGGWWQWGNKVPSGRLLVFNDRLICGFGRTFMPSGNAGQWFKGEAYRLFGTDRAFKTAPLLESKGRRRARPERSIVKVRWAGGVGLEVRAMVLAGDTLYIAGPLGDTRHSPEAFGGEEGIALRAFSALDGTPSGGWLLPGCPVFDGMIAARGRLLLSLADGSVLCLGPAELGSPLSSAPVPPLTVVNTTPRSAATPTAELPDSRTHPDFGYSSACRIGVGGRHTYRMVSDRQKTGLVLRKLPQPLTGRVSMKVRMQAVQGAGSGFYSNGFLAFGDGTERAGLVTCGLRIKITSLELCQGELGKGTIAKRDVVISQSGPIDVVVEVDLASGKVKARAGSRQIEGILTNPLKRITHVGYCLLNAATDFGKVDIESHQEDR